MSTGRRFTPGEDAYIRAQLGNLPHRDIAAQLGRSVGGVRKRIAAMGLSRTLRRWTSEEDQALRDGASTGRPMRDLATELARHVSEVSSRARLLGLSPWRTKRELTRGGHVIAGFADGRYILEHRVVMARTLGRPLADSEVVHHINTIKTDNEPGNLYLCSGAAEHQRVHRSLERLVPDLMAHGIIYFDRDQGAYQLCERVQ